MQSITFYLGRRRVIARLLRNLLRWIINEPLRRYQSRSEKAPTEREREDVIVCVRMNARTRMFNYGRTLRRNHGIRTILVTRAFEYDFQRLAFDEIELFFSYRQLDRVMRRIARRYCIKAVIGSFQPAAQAASLLGQERDWPVIIDNYDSYWALWYWSRCEKNSTTNSKNFSHDEIELERECLGRADGVLARSRVMSDAMRESGIDTPVELFEDRCNRLFFQSVPQDGRPRVGNEWSVVYPGIFYPMSFDRRLFGDAQLLPLAALFAEERIHFHLYPSPHHEYQYPEYEAEARNNPYFHMHHAVDFGRVHQEISQYDFGWLANDFSKSVSYSEIVRQSERSLKFYTFLEAGLPLIVNDTLLRYSDFVEQTGAGLVVERDAPRGLADRLARLDVAALRHSVESARESLEVDRIGRELVEFLDRADAHYRGRLQSKAIK
jgi:hypothetical protein